MPQTVVTNLDGRSLDAEHLAHERGKRRHWASQLAAENSHQLVELLVRRTFVDEHPQTPVPVSHDLRRFRDGSHVESADVGAFDLTFANAEDERHSAEVVRGSVVERQVARAHELAGTRLHVAALEMPGHGRPPIDGVE